MKKSMIDPGLYAQILPHVLTEVRKQVVAPERVIRLRLQLYYRVLHDMPFLWSNIAYTIRQASSTKHIVPITHEGTRWLHLPSVQSAEVGQHLAAKNPVITAWTSAVRAIGQKGAGIFGQSIVREAFRAAGWPVFNGAQVLLPDGSALEVDVPAIVGNGIPIWTEVKNKFSEVYVAPTVKKRMTEDDEQISRLFATAHRFGVTPILFASLVDRSFYGYQAAYQGLHFSYLFQYMPPEHQQVCDDVRNHFTIGHVKVLPLDPNTGQPIPPQYMVNQAKSIPALLQRTYGVHP
jgi:hypothetical protein